MTLGQESNLSAAATADAAPSDVLCLHFPDDPAEKPADYVPYAQRLLFTCAPKQTIAVVKPPEEVPPHVEGAPPASAPLDKLTLGPGVAWDQNNTVIIATRAGHVSLRHNMLCVEEKLDLHQDIDPTAGPIDFPGPVMLHKNILDLVHFTASGDLVVHGAIEAAHVHGRANVTVHHGICGKESGRVSAAGNITARFTSNAHVSAGGDLLIANEVSNSQLFCKGKFHGETACLLSGHITAMQGILCDIAGTENGAKLILELALSADEVAKLSAVGGQLKNLRSSAANIRGVVEPLLRNAKALTHQQKEKATELLYSAQETEQKITQIVAALEAPRKAIDAILKAPIVIRSMLHPGVSIRIAGAEVIVRKPTRGVLKILRADEGATPQILFFDTHNQPLPSPVTTTLPEHAAIQQLLKGQM